LKNITIKGKITMCKKCDSKVLPPKPPAPPAPPPKNYSEKDIRKLLKLAHKNECKKFRE
jgi:hypothetical protein